MEQITHQHEEAALSYLDKTGAIERLKEKCQIYANSNQMQTVYNFVLVVDPLELAEVDVEFGNLVLNQINLAEKVFQEVCFTAIHSSSLLPSVQYASQILIQLRVSNLPHLPSYQLDLFDLWRCKAGNRLYKFKGIVCSISTITKYTQAARYYCPVSSCDGSTGHHFIRMHTTGAFEFQTIRNDFVCKFCGSTLVEDISCRLLADKMVVQMFTCDALECHQKISLERSRYQSITVVLRGDLASGVNIGETYSIIGTPAYKYQEADVSVAFEANNIAKDFCLDSSTKYIPLSIERLYKDRKCSSWSFVASLAYIFGGNITPPGSYFRLKLGILLSLVQTPQTHKKSSKASRGLNILAVGCDTVILHRLLLYGASFSGRHLHHTGSNSLFATVTKDHSGTGACTIDGGSLMLCRGGVCTLGDLTCYKKETRDSLFHAMENGAITVSIPKKYSEGICHQQVSMPIGCNIWAYMATTSRCSQNRDILAQQDMGNIPKIFANPFGMIYCCDNTDTCWDDYIGSCLMNQVLTNAVLDEQHQSTIQSLVSGEDLQIFLDHVSTKSVGFTSAAEYLIKGYFVGSRRVRSAGIHGTPFPQTAMETIACMATAHAKLSLRNQAEDDDAVMAIMIYEECITARYGYSVLSVQPTAHFRDDNLSMYIGKENDLRMEQFKVQLTRFCLSHASELVCGLSEE